MADLIEMREEVSNLVISAIKEAEEHQDSFERYAYLWLDSPQEFMRHFLAYGRAVSPEDLDARAEETLPRTPPTLAQFQQQESVAPLFEVHMELDEEGLTFTPSLEVGGDYSFLVLIEGLISDIYNTAKLVPRLAKGRLNYKVSVGQRRPAGAARTQRCPARITGHGSDGPRPEFSMGGSWDPRRGPPKPLSSQAGLSAVLKALDSTWSAMEFEHEPHARTGVLLLKSDELLVETLEDNQVQLQNLMMSKYLSHFLKEVTSWQQKLSTADSVISIWFEVQRTWGHLESIFIGSEDIRAQLPEDSRLFDRIDQEFKVRRAPPRAAPQRGRGAGSHRVAGPQALMEDAVKTPNVVEATNKPGLYKKLEGLKKSLAVCEKALAEYLETKRLAFPRFYFVSSADLLDILSNGNNPVEGRGPGQRPRACGAASGHALPSQPLAWARARRKRCLAAPLQQGDRLAGRPVCGALVGLRGHSVACGVGRARDGRTLDEGWQGPPPGQTRGADVARCHGPAGFTVAFPGVHVSRHLSKLFDSLCKLKFQLDASGQPLKVGLGMYSKEDEYVDFDQECDLSGQVESSQAFTWQSQLRHRWDEEKRHCFANICDAQIQYSYEYLGNTPRLVITPLTDRCYITLTQSLHLIMGGAPAGPAGTGKTETTKDLGRALGTMVYVFNCSEQMDYKVKCVQDAIRAKKKTFNFLGEMIRLIPTVGLFITMNPGYAGRTELPENLKALFRPCAMVVPDFELICEIMLVAEGFLEARLLARKFITLYTLCKELLSKQSPSVGPAAGRLIRGRPVQVLKSLNKTYQNLKRRPVAVDLDPKAVTCDELFGIINPATREWKDGLFSTIMRDLANLTHDGPKWIVLDGDIDPMWIESLNTVMDDNKGPWGAGGLPQETRPHHGLPSGSLRSASGTDGRASPSGPRRAKGSGVRGFTQQPESSALSAPGFPGARASDTTLSSSPSVPGPPSSGRRRGAGTGGRETPGGSWSGVGGPHSGTLVRTMALAAGPGAPQVLTLASNERIPLNRTMRLVFEISHLRTATPATVSRAGILYINPADLGWNP
ncbi:PREDICTED: dynein heavy chain 17, axonemal-like [Condylura cristata]|uniref:dynein heavy chain 17, axonemal-like n=1 Tax=Condylura cristata TaxID=143302 RepID=UPI000643B66D|nr:PREDICTED: dynein heavy chain 17, axonemal-like [Condylura cristata]